MNLGVSSLVLFYEKAPKSGHFFCTFLFVLNALVKKISIINSHHLFVVSSHVFNSSVAFDANLLRSFLFIPSKILQKSSLLVFGGNVVMWANKVSVVSNLVGWLTRLFSTFWCLLPNLGSGGKSFSVGCSRLEFLALYGDH